MVDERGGLPALVDDHGDLHVVSSMACAPAIPRWASTTAFGCFWTSADARLVLVPAFPCLPSAAAVFPRWWASETYFPYY
jgi:hypothetical protein